MAEIKSMIFMKTLLTFFIPLILKSKPSFDMVQFRTLLFHSITKTDNFFHSSIETSPLSFTKSTPSLNHIKVMEFQKKKIALNKKTTLDKLQKNNVKKR